MGLVTADGGRTINTSGGVIHFTGIAWAGEAGEPVSKAPHGAREVPFASGACMAVPRAVWQEQGGFSPDFFMYHEDVDLSLRLRLARRADRDRARRARRPRLRVPQGTGQVAAAGAKPVGDDHPHLPGRAAGAARTGAAGHGARADARVAGRRLGAAEGARVRGHAARAAAPAARAAAHPVRPAGVRAGSSRPCSRRGCRRPISAAPRPRGR